MRRILIPSQPVYLFLWFGLVWRDSWIRLWAEFPVSPSHHVGFTPRLLYSSTPHSPRKFHPSENRLSSRCLTSVIVRKLVFPCWHQPPLRAENGQDIESSLADSCTLVWKVLYWAVSNPKYSFFHFRQTWTKVNVSWMSNGARISYQQKKVFHFRRDLSVAGEDQLLTLPNVPMIVSRRLPICNLKYSPWNYIDRSRRLQVVGSRMQPECEARISAVW